MEIKEVKDLANKFEKRIKLIGPDSEQIKWLTGIINNKIPNPKRLMVIEGIWAHEKAYESGLEINSFYICPELIYANEGRRTAEKFIELASNIFVISKKVFRKSARKKEILTA